MTTKWNVSGTYFESCNCEAICPCQVASPPTEGDCTAFLAWHVNEGSFGDVVLDGLNAAFSLYSPGNMAHGKWQVALYLDDQGSDPQIDALTQIFTGQAGGPIAAMSGLIENVLGVATVSMGFDFGDGKASLRIGDVGKSDIEAIAGADGGEVTISNPPLNMAVPNPSVIHRSTQMTYQDHGYAWMISGKNGLLADFAYKVEG